LVKPDVPDRDMRASTTRPETRVILDQTFHRYQCCRWAIFGVGCCNDRRRPCRNPCKTG